MAITSTLRQGSTGSQVSELQQMLGITPDGIFGPQTAAAVRAFQQQQGLTADGIVGPITIGALYGGGSGSSSSSNKGSSSSSSNQNNSYDESNSYSSSNSGQLYFMDDIALVRLVGQGPQGQANSSTIWLVDKKTKTLRPFANEEAVANFFDGDVTEDMIQTVPASALNSGGLLGANGNNPGYQVLGPSYAIKSDGTASPLNFSNSQLAARYGQGINQDGEQQGYMILDGFLDMIKNADAGIDRNTVEDIRENPEKIAFYINALTYGGYTLSDVYRDMKADELGINNIAPISSTATRSQYQGTSAGSAAYADSRIAPPQQIGALSGNSLNLAIYDLPDEAFKTLIPILDYNSDEFKAAMDEVQSAYHDILSQQVNAQTEQEKAVADYNWEQFRTQIEEQYGIQLSNNALEAWDQIESLYASHSERGIFNSGLQAESIDDYLRKVRRNDANLRTDKLTKEEQQEMSYFRNFATPDQIKSLIESDPDKAQSWGLVPSDEVKNEMTFDNLKAKYPDLSDDEINRYISSVLDDNGNYRSDLYSKQAKSLSDISSDKRLYQQQMVIEKSLRDEEKAYKEFTTPDSPFLRATNASGDDAFYTGEAQKNATSSFDNLTNTIQNSIKQQQQQEQAKVQAQDRSADKKSSGSSSSSSSSSVKSTAKPIAVSTNAAPLSVKPNVGETYPSAAFGTNNVLKAPEGPMAYGKLPETPNQKLTQQQLGINTAPKKTPEQKAASSISKATTAVKNTVSNAWNKIKSIF